MATQRDHRAPGAGARDSDIGRKGKGDFVKTAKTSRAKAGPKSAPAISPSGSWALFLDVDGTLLHLAESPDAVRTNAHLHRIIERLKDRLGGAVALISGRSLTDLDRLFAPLRLPASGLHGIERRDSNGRLHCTCENTDLDEFRKPLEDFAKAWPGVLIEDKGLALALHYRQAPGAEDRARSLVDRIAKACETVGVLDGKMVFEIKPRHAGKGAAIEAFMAEPPFRGRDPVFVGDDVTDEDGFAAVNRLGGLSIRVGANGSTVASHYLADVDSVIDWLHACAEKAAAESGRLA